MMNELKKVEEIKSYLRGMKSAKTLKTKKECLKNIKRINNDIKYGVIGLDYFIAKYENAKRFYSKDMDEILKNVESAIEVLKEDIKKENEEKNANIVDVEFNQEKMNYKLNLATLKEYNSYIEEYFEDFDIDLINEGYEIGQYKVDNCIESIEEILNNIYISILYSGVLNTKVIQDIVNTYKLDNEKINLQIEKSAYSSREVDIVLFNEKNQRWYWITVELENKLDYCSTEPIPQGIYDVNKILFFEID